MFPLCELSPCTHTPDGVSGLYCIHSRNTPSWRDDKEQADTLAKARRSLTWRSSLPPVLARGCWRWSRRTGHRASPCGSAAPQRGSGRQKDILVPGASGHVEPGFTPHIGAGSWGPGYQPCWDGAASWPQANTCFLPTESHGSVPWWPIPYREPLAWQTALRDRASLRPSDWGLMSSGPAPPGLPHTWVID